MTAVPDIDDVLHRLDRIQDLMGQLAKARGDFVEQQDIAERIRREIHAAKMKLMPVRSVDRRE
jgi:hypothetical protein